MKSNKPIRRVLVLGGGIAGATVVERPGREDLDVQWVDKEPCVGGQAEAICAEMFQPECKAAKKSP